MSWFVTAHGFQILAVALPASIEVYMKKRVEKNNMDNIWQLESKFSFDDDNVKSVTWLPNGTILATTVQNSFILRSSTESNGFSSIVADLAGRLSDHHPLLLAHYLVAGKYDHVKSNLSILHLFIKNALESKKKYIDTPTILWTLVGLNIDSENNATSLEDPISANESNSANTIAREHIELMVDNIPKLQLKGIGDADRSRLSIFVRAFFDLDQHKGSLDDNGVRYLLSAIMALKSADTNIDLHVISRDIAWAFYSESQDVLLDIIGQSTNRKTIWSTAKALGVGWWIKNPETLVKNN